MKLDAGGLYVIQRRFILLFLPWLVVIVASGMVALGDLHATLRAPLLYVQENALWEAIRVTSQNIAALRRDILLVASVIGSKSADEAETGRHEAEEFFVKFAQAAEQYDQVRWIDERGREKVRVNYRERRATRVAPSELQDKSDRPYFRDAIGLQSGEIYFSALDLNIEHGRIETPIQPMLRIATPIFGIAGERRGVAVLNYRADILLDRLREIQFSNDLEIHLLNQEGYWLLAPNHADEWGWMLDNPDETLVRINPALWQSILVSDRGVFEDTNGIWSFERFNLMDGLPQQQIKQIAAINQITWRLLVRLPREHLISQERKWRLLILLTCLGATGLAFWFASRLTLAGRALEERSRELEHTNRDLRQSMDKLRVLQDELVQAEKLSSLGLMVAGVAHELNTPLGGTAVALSALRQQVEQLRNRIATGLKKSDLERFIANTQEGVTLATATVERAAGLVKQFKQLAVDRTTMEKRRFDLIEVVYNAHHLLHKWDSKRPIRLVLDIPDDLTFDSYPGPLGQVVGNLVDNALIHAFPDGRRGVLRVSASASGEKMVRIIVEDDGVGIPIEIQPKVFDPFFTTRRSGDGTGLGLHLVHQLVTTLLEGRIDVQSSTEETDGTSGTRVTVTLPRVVKHDQHR
jgi:signal transduction histidine kinase